MTKKPLKKSNLRSELSESDLQKLAQAGTKEAISKIEAYIKSEKDVSKKALAEMFLEECEFDYYQPKNEKEEEDFLLCVLIDLKQKKIGDMQDEINEIEAGLFKFSLEQKVHAKVLAKNKNKKEDWKHHYMDDFVSFDKNKIAELLDDVAYEEAWVAEAKKMIVNARYKKGIPERHLSHFDFGFDDESADDGCCDCDDDCCSSFESRADLDMVEEVPF